MGDYRWFDEKAKSGSLSYEDKKRLFNQVFSEAGIVLKKREQEKLEVILQNQLHTLKCSSDNKESAHTIAHSMLTCFPYLMGLDEEKFKEYIERYQKAMRKHEVACVFKKNYTHSKIG